MWIIIKYQFYMNGNELSDNEIPNNLIATRSNGCKSEEWS